MLHEIVKLEGREAGDEEIAAEIEQVSAPWGSRAEQVRASLESDQGRQAMSGRILASKACLLYTSPSPRDRTSNRMPSSA